MVANIHPRTPPSSHLLFFLTQPAYAPIDMFIIVTGFSIPFQATLDGRIRPAASSTNVGAAIAITCTPVQEQAEPACLVVEYPKDQVFLIGFLRWLLHRHRCGQSPTSPTTFEYHLESHEDSEKVLEIITQHLQPGSISPQELLVQFATFVRRQGNRKYEAGSYEAAIDLYESSLLLLSEWENHISDPGQWTESSLACFSNIIQARICLNQHAAARSYLQPSLSLATHPGDANLRQRIKLLYRCALVAEASSSLLLASCILSFASALGRHHEDLLHEISSLQDTVHTRLRSTSHSALPDSISRLPGRMADSDESAECPICIAQFSGKIIRLSCEHEFHEHCIATWLEYGKTCPLCRKGLVTQ
jgi:hypothetical protein